MNLEEIKGATEDAGFSLRGAFHPASGDGAPQITPGVPVATLVLVGNAGPRMWARFSQERNPASESLDAWSRENVSAVAAKLGALALFPFDKPPLPFQRWAARAEDCHPSPLGLFIHPDHGLWHAYRGALAFAERIDLPEAVPRASPCASCSDRPCLAACPVGAFDGRGYDVAACVRHLALPEGAGCMKKGCRARRACPVGRDCVYEPAQAEFHMRAFLRARRVEGLK